MAGYIFSTPKINM